MTLQERIESIRPLQVVKNGKMMGYLIDKEEYLDYCRVKLAEVSRGISAKARKRGLTAAKLQKLLADE